MIWFILICLALIVIFQAFPLALPLFIAFFVWMFYREFTKKTAAPQPTAAPAAKKLLVFRCPFCGYSTGTAGVYFDNFLCCSECQRHSYGDGTITGRTEEHKRLLAQEAHDCQRISAGEYQAVIDALCNSYANLSKHNKASFNFSATQATCQYLAGNLSTPEWKTEIIASYSPLATEAGRMALALACVKALKTRSPHLQFDTFYYGFASKYR